MDVQRGVIARFGRCVLQSFEISVSRNSTFGIGVMGTGTLLFMARHLLWIIIGICSYQWTADASLWTLRMHPGCCRQNNIPFLWNLTVFDHSQAVLRHEAPPCEVIKGQGHFVNQYLCHTHTQMSDTFVSSLVIRNSLRLLYQRESFCCGLFKACVSTNDWLASCPVRFTHW
jgi:hypothetical protein